MCQGPDLWHGPDLQAGKCRNHSIHNVAPSPTPCTPQRQFVFPKATDPQSQETMKALYPSHLEDSASSPSQVATMETPLFP